MAKIPVVDQATNFYKKLNTLQKALIASILVIVVGGLIWVAVSASSEEMAVLYSSLDPGDASKITESLKEKNIDYKLEDDGTKILVDKDQIYQARLDLASEGLPETSIVGYEIFDKTNLGMSEFVQKINFRRALEGELARTIGAMEEVNKVRVHIVLPEKALFEKDQKETTSSVTLSLKSGRSLSRINVEGIQNLIAGSIEGMQPDNVTVINQRGKILSEKSRDKNSVAGLSATQYDQQKNVETYLANKVQSLLNGVLGQGNSEVRVNAELDFTQIEKTITDYDPERQVERSTQIIEEKSQTADSLSYPYVNMAKDQSNTISNFEISNSVEKIIQGVGTIKRLSVATLINGTVKVIDKDGQKALEYVPREENEMKDLTEIVKNSIGYDPSRNDQVTVLNVPFDTRIQEENLEQYYKIPWYEDPEYQKLILLVIAMLITVFVMFRLLQSKQVKDRLRIALQLPEKGVEEEVVEEELEDIDIDEEELLLMPAELPDQLLLEPDFDEEDEDSGVIEYEGEGGLDKEALADRARAKLDEAPEMTESAIMKLELKNKVESFLDEEPEDAVKLIRLLLVQDPAKGGFNL